MRATLSLLAFMLATPAFAQAESGGASEAREESGARWHEMLVGELCPKKPANALSCTIYVIRARNDSPGVIECRGELLASASASRNPGQSKLPVAIAPGATGVLASMLIADSSSPVMDTTCRLIPGEAPPFVATPDCEEETQLDSPDNFYPPGSTRRGESGETILEFTVTAGVNRSRDVEIVKSSGWADLDNAALRIARALRVSTRCADHRVRRSILFEIGNEPVRQVGCQIFGPTGTVLVSTVEGSN